MTDADKTIAASSWLVIPLYNEETVVGDVIRHARLTFPHVVCVDDGSTDGSAEAARKAGAHVVRHPINLGQGAALQTGLRYALTDTAAQYFVTFDSDGQHRVEDALDMVRRLAAEPLDIIVGSRFLDNRTKPGAIKRVVLKAAVMFQNTTSGVRLTDAHNGLRALSRHAASSIRVTQNRMAHASEIVNEIGRLKLRYDEQPVHIIYTDYSRSKGQSVWNSVNIMSDLIFK
ncbi:glycosyltransferase family 2 protein [Cryobacterium melibiosiphilum]|uniref:glycosyltransferase family 2 protein n=1 Tax=Cryobacterium melibiosiphilum TaxID=995039 RepID=UPI001F224AAB|nr:glycosyltransferase family 2 protein [Cryobacterium melibiosiphilum]